MTSVVTKPCFDDAGPELAETPLALTVEDCLQIHRRLTSSNSLFGLVLSPITMSDAGTRSIQQSRRICNSRFRNGSRHDLAGPTRYVRVSNNRLAQVLAILRDPMGVVEVDRT